MLSFPLQAWAVLVIAYKRLSTQRSLALATAIGLATSVALVLSVPLYADATQFRLLRRQLVNERGSASYAPLQFVFHHDGGMHDTPQWSDGQAVDQYLSTRAEAEIGLPTMLMARRFSTESLQLYPPLDPNNAQSKYFITWSHFGFVNHPEKLLKLVSGTFPSAADPSPATPVEVLVHETTAEALAIHA